MAEARVARARGDAGAELGYARRAIALGQEFGDPDLVALASTSREGSSYARERVEVLGGGLMAWAEAGLPVEGEIEPATA